MRLPPLLAWSFALLLKSLRRRLVLLLSCAFLIVILLKWKFTCTDVEPRLHVQSLCSSYANGHSFGSLCRDLCQPEGISSLSCHSHYEEKETVFTGTWRNYSAVFKSAKKPPIGTHHRLDISNKVIYSEHNSINMIKATVKLKFNISINDIDAKIIYKKQLGPMNNLYRKIENIWSLFQDNEYVALVLFEEYGIFPKLLGTCGSLYAVEKLETVSGYWHLMTLYDSLEEWEKRIKISIMIMDLLLHLEDGVPESLSICDIKLNHFGVTSDFKKIMYLNLDTVHPFSVASRITGDGSQCKHHSDCDYLDCRSFCNLITYKCQHGVINNNLQIVCERIFLGWLMSGRVMVPGLLLGPRTPRVLIELLELCANPASETGKPRAPASKEIRKRLYNLLVNLI